MAIKAIVFDAYGTLYDVQSVARMTRTVFPGHGAYITRVWRLRQLEYSWLRSLMGRFRALRMQNETLGFAADAVVGSLLALPEVVAEMDLGRTD